MLSMMMKKLPLQAASHTPSLLCERIVLGNFRGTRFYR
ncbi:hypothetical protein GLA29479_4634 [Lysobacter antibioticus]|nr:hypothetical protein GLA29479_4634 [Lysobacter antibioticus]